MPDFNSGEQGLYNVTKRPTKQQDLLSFSGPVKSSEQFCGTCCLLDSILLCAGEDACSAK